MKEIQQEAVELSRRAGLEHEKAKALLRACDYTALVRSAQSLAHLTAKRAMLIEAAEWHSTVEKAIERLTLDIQLLENQGLTDPSVMDGYRDALSFMKGGN